MSLFPFILWKSWEFIDPIAHMNNNINWAMKKKLVVYGKYGIILPNYVGLKMNCKDPYLTTQYFMERIQDPGCFSVAQMEVNGIFRQLASPNIYYFTDFLNPAPPPKKKKKQLHGIVSWAKLILRMNINQFVSCFCCVFPIEGMDGLV